MPRLKSLGRTKHEFFVASRDFFAASRAIGVLSPNCDTIPTDPHADLLRLSRRALDFLSRMAAGRHPATRFEASDNNKNAIEKMIGTEMLPRIAPQTTGHVDAVIVRAAISR